MAKADIMAGRAFVSLYVKGTAFTKGLSKARKELTDFGSGIMGIGASIAGAGLAISGAFTGALAHFANVGGALDDLSQRTGISIAALVELGHAAEMGGTDMATLEGAIARMQKGLGASGGASKALTESLERIGLSTEMLEGLKPDEQFDAIAKGIAAIEDPADKAATAMAIFGKSGAQLMPMINDLQKFREEARELGITPSPESVSAAAEIGDAIDRVRKVISAAIFEIGASIAPMAADVLAGFLQVVKAARKFITENRNLVVIAAKVGAVLTVVGSAIVAIGAGFVGAGLAISGVLSVISAFSAAAGLASSIIAAIGTTLGLLLTPVGLLIVALAAGAIAWVRFTQSGQTAVRTLVTSVTTLFSGLRKTVGDTFAGIVEAIRAGDLSLAGQIAMVGLRLVIAQGVEAISGLFGNAISGIVAKILNGDLTGAWASVGSTILKTWANVAKSIVNIFTEAIRAIDKALDGRVSKISKALAIIKDGEGGIIKAAFTSLLPSKEKDDPLNKALNAIDEAAKFVAEATDMAANDAMGGAGEGASQAVKDLKAELDALRKQAAEKMEAGRIGSPEEDEIDQPGSGQKTGGMGGRASVATNSLAALAQMAQGPQSRMERLAQQQIKKQEDQIEVLEDVAMGIRNMGLFHA
jgi:hypothetical protein